MDPITAGVTIAVVFITFYFLPTLVALGRYRAGAIFALNLFLGWTLVGWVGALVWALGEKYPPESPPRYTTTIVD